MLYKQGRDLANFQHHILTRAVNCGLDYVMQAPNPIDTTRMSRVVHEHTRFSIESIESVMEEQVLKYESYDRTNDAEISQLLLNLLDPELAKELQDSRNTIDSFPIGAFPKTQKHKLCRPKLCNRATEIARICVFV